MTHDGGSITDAPFPIPEQTASDHMVLIHEGKLLCVSGSGLTKCGKLGFQFNDAKDKFVCKTMEPKSASITVCHVGMMNVDGEKFEVRGIGLPADLYLQGIIPATGGITPKVEGNEYKMLTKLTRLGKRAREAFVDSGYAHAATRRLLRDEEDLNVKTEKKLEKMKEKAVKLELEWEQKHASLAEEVKELKAKLASLQAEGQHPVPAGQVPPDTVSDVVVVD